MKLSKEIMENGCAKAAIDGEPVFILLGRDPDAPAAVRAWVEERLKRKGCWSEKMHSALDRADEMQVYQVANKCRSDNDE